MQLARVGAMLLRATQGTASVRLLQPGCRPPALEASRLGVQPRHSRAGLRCCSALGTRAEGRKTAGELHVAVGPMFAGKTTSLLKFMADREREEMRCMLVKSAKDTRSSADKVKAHSGEEMECRAFKELSMFLGTPEYRDSEVIGIDEAQFFPDLLEFCKQSVDQDGKIVFVAGLDGDYRRETFGKVVSLIPIADTVQKLHGTCGSCGTAKSVFTLRTVKASQVELIGGGESYMAVCRACYNRATQHASASESARKPVLESAPTPATVSHIVSGKGATALAASVPELPSPAKATGGAGVMSVSLTPGPQHLAMANSGSPLKAAAAAAEQRKRSSRRGKNRVFSGAGGPAAAGVS